MPEIAARTCLPRFPGHLGNGRGRVLRQARTTIESDPEGRLAAMGQPRLDACLWTSCELLSY